MSGQRVALQPAFVLHTRAFRDSSLLLEVLTRDYGRVALVARGVRGGSAARRAQLQPFRELLLSFAGSRELKSLAQVEEAGSPLALSGEPLVCGFYLNELLLRLLQREDPHPGTYELYRETLHAMLAGGPLEVRLRLFEHRLLGALGFGLVLDRDTLGEPLREDAEYHYVAETGPIPVGAGGAGQRVSGRCLAALRAGDVPPACAAQLKRLLRAALTPYLGAAPLKSRELAAALRRAPGARDGGEHD